mgnify:CR=1 FL=1
MSNWIPIARCERPPMRDQDHRIIWEQLSNLTLPKIEDLYQKHHLLVASRFEEDHRILVGAPLATDLVIRPLKREAS